MIPRKNRLPREAFRARGYQTLTTPFFSVKTKDNSLGVNRIGVVIGKSVDKRATRRNFWERQAKIGFLRTSVVGTAAGKGRDFLVMVFPKINSITKKEFVELFEGTIQKLKQ